MINLYNIARFNTPIRLRNAARLRGFVNLSVTYMQLIAARLHHYIINSNLHAVMTPQVCYLEKLLQMYVSPAAVINPPATQIVFWQENEPSGIDVFIHDSLDDFYLSSELLFTYSNFTVVLPTLSQDAVVYTKELLNKYKLPTKNYTIISSII